METKKFCLTERQMPTQWYNIVADMPNKPLPPLHPATKQPVTKEQMSAIFAEELIDQEMSAERFIDIPEEVQEIYKIWRPTPLVRATGLEKALGTPAKIYFKNESVSPAGSHKPNTAVPQAYYNYKQGIRRLTTETGAGQWGAAIAFAAKHFGIDLQVYMVKVSYEQKPYRRLMMNTWGAECIASPSTLTASGRAALERDPNCSGSLGLAISEAIEVALQHPEDTRYCLGSVLNHVILHQTVIGQEAVAQMEMADAEPDVVIGCFGGGSNFAGLGFTRRYDLKSFDAITSTILVSRGGAYEYRYLMKAGRRVVRVSAFYLKNYDGLCEALSEHCVYKGRRPMNLWLEMKEIFR